MRNAITLRALPAIFAALLLAACGGGGGSGAPAAPAPAPVPAPSGGCVAQIVSDTTVGAGRTASASALACAGATMGEVSWSQVSGPVVTLNAPKSPTVSFETQQAGVVTLRADVRLENGQTHSATTEITVEPPTPFSYVTVRTDHAIRPGTNTSVRAWPEQLDGLGVSRIVWTQVAGPTVEMNTDNERVMMFKAPVVAADTILKFRAVMTTSLGGQSYDDVTVSVERVVPATDSLYDMTARVHPYRTAARYAGVLRACTYDTNLYYTDSVRNNLCKAGTLPLLQEEAGPGVIPSVEQIMGRVLVSHDFLGANFEQFLLTQDPHGDFRRMLGGTTAIVLGSHVRPSFYMSATGAIYLDAANLWLTPEQRDVVTEVPDYRLAFDDELKFSSFGRLVRGNEYARRSFPSTERLTRTQEELVMGLGRLLYHELAHAGDFFTPAQRALNPAQSIWENVVNRISSRMLVSDLLASTYPLTSVEMRGLGQVLFLGATATEEQKAYTAADVGRFFSSDVASDEYAYSINGNSSSREDLAMLFEEFMMVYRHGLRYDMAFTNVYQDGTPSGQVLVAWGQRGRIGEPAIRPRLKLVLQQVAPWIDPATVDTLPAPQMMRVGQSWDANLVLGTGTGTSMSGISARRMETPAQAAERLRDDLKKPRD